MLTPSRGGIRPPSLKLCPTWDAGERNDVPDIRHAGDVHQGAFETQAEAGMRNRSVLADIEIPLIALEIANAHFPHPLQQHIVAFLALAAANYFSNFRNEHIHCTN